MTLPETAADRTFQVDLRGLVDLLSHHLYSSPRVYLRELLQNAVDALTARHALEPAAPAGSFGVRLYADGTVVRVEDDGVGLTEADVHTFLATIGRSSKRAMGVPPDEPIRGWGKITEQRDDFIGRFGIGLLSCFLVADEIHVLSRSARTPDAPAVEWRGRGDGSYTVRVLPASAHPRPGTTVTLAPRADAGEWTRPAQVHALARHFGSLLRHPVTFDDGTGAASVNPEPAPWARTYPTPGARSRALTAYGEEVFGFEPLDTVELDLPAVGLKGIACVLPETVPAGRSHGHRVHVKGMLLSEQAEEILPEWAFFVRCVIDAESLRPTASRESLYEDDTLAAVRDALAERLRAWIARAAASDPDLLARFLQVHHLAVKSLAVHDDEILRMLLPWLPFETTDGHTTLDEFARTHRTVLVTSSVEEFRQVAAIASAAGLGVVNGGYTYDRELVHRLPEIRSEVTVADLDPATLTAHLDPVDRETELAAGAYLAQARDALAVFDCDVALRTFQPASAPALLVDSREARHERTRSRLAREQEGGLWGDILGALRQEAPRAQLILNQLNPLVRTAVAIDEPELARTSAEALYGQAALLSRRPLRPAESSLINRSFLDLLAHALRKDS
ncbi:HSP90 family protein [Streptomyces sp. YIM B13518]|uniref:HSP90 family protein n=1 Tax=Streptomyces sp. YIM B13518 TaxID=3366316 RepID=UPI00367F742A